ncbi:MAG: outer membrane protein assembly factor BamD [Burkholderiales bacterium]|nr:outer membrane protein assembly factor BamD [Burkholderiales bacterium]
MKLRSLAALVLALALAGCGWFKKGEIDETADWSAQRLYTEAKEEMAGGNWSKAVKLFEKLEARYPFGRYAQQAQLEIAYAYYRDNEPASAIAACDRFIKLHPNHPNVDYAYYLKGIVNFNEDMGFLADYFEQDPTERDAKAMREAFDAFKELAVKFPDSKYTPDALARMRWLVNALASHELAVARYYMKRGAYVAAANRVQFVVKTYPEAPANEEALAILAAAYDRLGLTDLRDDAVRVLAKNFPQSPYLKTEYTGRRAPWWKIWAGD